MSRLLEASEIRQSETGPSVPIMIVKDLEAAAWSYGCATPEELAKIDFPLYEQILQEIYAKYGLETEPQIGNISEAS